ncbi:hypothetical protein CA600_07005 [Paenibacillus sp. VTT E-133280]|uniref:hypothetical protein n=1 Tax=Paenibacillus sp. VTT E-133280 TaxID=1986222 RepID=UPI000B9FAF09|nr:hypothetical protein [Paenibacillus sp. VTT E-133280]OZQ68005.1 hypothetical protein CA600_07005 [Paenibacillus sp. VTT E-133280]
MKNIEDVSDRDEIYDFDLNEVEIAIPESLKIDMSNIFDVNSVVIIDFNYLFSKIKERFEHYEGIYIKVNTSDILREIKGFIDNYIENDSEIRFFVFYSNEEEYKISENLNTIDDFMDKTPNGVFYEFSNNDYYMGTIANTINFLKEYYVNEDYFGLDKIILIMDNPDLNNILELLPTINRNPNEADVILVRNHNSETYIVVPVVYFVIDYMIDKMFSVSNENAMLWDSYKGTEQELFIKNKINEELSWT